MSRPSPETRPRLFCKPLNGSDNMSLDYHGFHASSGAGISFRSLDLRLDLDLIYDWVNRDYSKRFWQLSGTKALVEATYRNILENPGTHSFIGLFNGRPVCQLDVYLLLADELWYHVNDPKPNDCGFHLLMVPPRQSEKGLSKMMLRAFFEFYFSFKQAERVFGEPDKENILANRLAIISGMEFQHTVRLSYKEANLYSITKQQFHETQSDH